MKLIIAAGTALGLAGMMFAASTFSGSSQNVQAGQETPVCVTYTPTRTATRTPTVTASPTNTATPTETPTTVLISNERRSDELYGNIADGGISGGSSEGGVSSLGNETPRAECPTPTRTGTRTATPANTSTPVNTSVPATNTPSGGGAGVVTPPNTGTGDGGDSGISMWMLLAGAAVAAAGGGALMVGARKRS